MFQEEKWQVWEAAEPRCTQAAPQLHVLLGTLQVGEWAHSS